MYKTDRRTKPLQICNKKQNINFITKTDKTMINKTEAQNKLNDLKEEVAKLEKIINQPADIKDRVNSFADACEVLNIKTYGDAKRILGLKEKYGFKNDRDIHSIDNPTLKLKIIAFALNEGWKPNWCNHDEIKYYPYFYNGEDGSFSYNGFRSLYSYSHLASGLYLKSSELAIYFGEQFWDIYKKHIHG